MDYEEAKSVFRKHLNYDIRTLIGDFSILWNLYERNLLNIAERDYREYNSIRGESIYQEQIHKSLIDKLRREHFMNEQNKEMINSCFNDFKEYYIKNCKEWRSFSAAGIIDYFHVNIANANVQNEVFELFDRNKYRQTWDYWDQLHLLLIIVYRVRNNMFHGNKIITKLEDEKDLFIICNNVLSLLLDDIESFLRTTS